MTQMPETINVVKHPKSLPNYPQLTVLSSSEVCMNQTPYIRADKYEALKQSYDRLCHLLENYTFLDEGMDEGTRPEIYAESKKALAEAEKVSAE